MKNIKKFLNINHFGILIIIFLGFSIRIYLFKNNGTHDLIFFSNFLKALIDYENLSFLYYPGFQNIINWREYNLPLMYPPGFLYILFILSKIYLYLNYLDAETLIKISVVFFEFLLLLYFILNFKNKNYFFIIFVWLNPVILITGSALGYVESIFIFFLILSIILLKKKYFFYSSIFFIASCSIKQLSLVLLPVIFIYYLRFNSFKKNLIILFSILFLIILFLLPIIFSSINFSYQDTSLGFLKNMYWGIVQNYISANGLNIWWIYSGYADTMTMVNQDYNIKEIITNLNIKYLKSYEAWDYKSIISRILVLIFTLFNLIIVFKLKKYTDFIKLLFFQYFSYITFATGTHENHAVLLSYLSILAFLFDRNFKVPCLIINSYTFLNIWMFYGFNGQNILRQSFIWQSITLLLSLFITLYFFYLYIHFFKKIKMFNL